ncbi:MAG: hypothetical protein II859_10095 [Bacteroidales bacterium]|nr:hypothetical protein [Bacteroidales bacterium]
MGVEDCIWLILKGLLATVAISLLSLLIGTLVGCGLYALSLNRRRWLQNVSKWWKVVVPALR